MSPAFGVQHLLPFQPWRHLALTGLIRPGPNISFDHSGTLPRMHSALVEYLFPLQPQCLISTREDQRLYDYQHNQHKTISSSSRQLLGVSSLCKDLICPLVCSESICNWLQASPPIILCPGLIFPQGHGHQKPSD